MYEKKVRSIFFENLEVDEEGKFIIKTSDNKKIIIELNDKEIHTIENWYHILTKHNLRFDIWNILNLFSELNITQISQLVEQSKSTVARHLKSMEDDYLLVSRRANHVQKGRISPKLYSINRKLAQIVEFTAVAKKPPDDPLQLLNFYNEELQMYRFTFYRYLRVLNLMNPFLDEFEDQLSNIGKAKQFYKKYFSFGKFEPWFSAPYYISEKYYNKFLDIYIDFSKKRQELLKIQNEDPSIKEKSYMYLDVLLPIKEYLKFSKKRMK